MKISDFKYINLRNSHDTIFKHIEEFYTNNNKLKTYKHVLAVAETNIKIAKRYELDIAKCYLSALLHDASAVMNPKDMVLYAIDHGIVLDKAEEKYPFLLHQQISKFFAEEVFGVIDNDVLSSITCHTTLNNNPSKYDLALFIADKLSWDQEGEPPFYSIVNDALNISLEAAALQYIRYMFDNNLILYPHKWLIEAKEYLEAMCY